MQFISFQEATMPSAAASTQREKRERYRVFLRHVEVQLRIFRSMPGCEMVVFALERRRTAFRSHLGLRNDRRGPQPPLQPTVAAMQAPIHPPAMNMDISSTPSTTSEASSTSDHQSTVESVPNDDADSGSNVPSQPDEPMDTTNGTSHDEDPRDPRGTPGRILTFKSNISDITIWAIILFLMGKHKFSRHCLLDIFRAFNALVHATRPIFPSNWTSMAKAFDRFIPVKAQWTLFCPNCDNLLEQTFEVLPDNPTCPRCDRELTDDIKSGKGSFFIIPLKAQIESFVKQGHLRRLLLDLQDMPTLEQRGGPLRDALQDNVIALKIGSDAAPLTNWPQKTCYGLVAFFDELPPCYQRRFPLLLAVYCGSSHFKPTTDDLYAKFLEELDRIQLDPVQWIDGTTRTVAITMANGDCPELRCILHQSTSGYYACPCCTQPGFWDGSYVRYMDLVHETNYDIRTEQHRILCAELVEQYNDAHPNEAGEILGVRSYPILSDRPYFDATFSVSPDMLHVAFLGLGKRLLRELCKHTGKIWTLRRTGQAKFRSTYFCIMYLKCK